MKVAILVSGQPRNFTLGFKELEKMYLDRYNCDVYIHTWDDYIFSATQFFPDRPQSVYHMTHNWRQDMLSLYHPKDYIAEKPKIFDSTGIVDKMWRQPLQNTKSMWYSVKSAFDLVPPTYDVYIRTRFDLQYESSTLDLKHLDLTKLHVWDWDTNQTAKNKGYYDVFAVGGYETMSLYCNVYQRLHWYLTHDKAYQRFLNGESGLRNEYLLRWHLQNSGVPVDVHTTTILGADGHIIR